MARIQYSLRFKKNTDTTRVLLMGVRQSDSVLGTSATPQARIYKVGDTPPSFTDMTASTGTDNWIYQITGFSTGLYIFEFKRGSAEIELGRLNAELDMSATCYPSNTEVEIDVHSLLTGVLVEHTVSNFLGADPARSVSVDGGTVYKSVTPAYNVFFSNSELSLAGITQRIDDILIKRTSNDCVFNAGENFLFDYVINPDLEAEISGTNETSPELDDGSVTINVTNGSGEYLVTWWDATTTSLSSGTNPQSATKTNVAAGMYTVVVEDLNTEQSVELVITITEPQVVPDTGQGSILEVPMLNSIAFVVPETQDGCSVLQTLDNTLFRDQYFPGYEPTNYFQKVAKCDSPIVQFNSDFPDHSVGLYRCSDNEFIKSFPVELKEENIGVIEDFTISIRNHTGHPGQSRVYFTGGTIPIPLSVGESFEILNNSDDFNGVYTIVDILTDSITGNQYLVINLTYDAPGSTSAGTGRFDVSNEEFNVFEAICDLIDVDNGVYYIRIDATNPADEDNTKYAISEPMDIQVEHPKTNLLEYSNEDNGLDITWTTGYQGRIRVPSVLFRRLPGGEVDTSRDSDYSLVTTAGKPTRGVLLQTFMLPPYMHEKLSVIFKLDFKYLNKVQYNTLEGYAEPQYIEQVMLSNSSIKLEQVGWFRKYNSDDIGTVNEGGFIATETGFLKR